MSMNKKALSLFLSLVLAGATQAETVFVTLEKDNALAVVDPVAGKLIKTVPVGQRPRGIAISPDNKVFVYSNQR
jgi:YVTN family beta-propeller protein